MLVKTVHLLLRLLMPLPLLLLAGDNNLPVSSTSEGATRREEQCGKRVSACMHIQFAFHSRMYLTLGSPTGHTPPSPATPSSPVCRQQQSTCVVDEQRSNEEGRATGNGVSGCIKASVKICIEFLTSYLSAFPRAPPRCTSPVVSTIAITLLWMIAVLR